MSSPSFPCVCGHVIEAHGQVEETEGAWHWDDDHNEEVYTEASYPRPVCWDCGPYDCEFVEMNNLEYLAYKHETKKETTEQK